MNAAVAGLHRQPEEIKPADVAYLCTVVLERSAIVLDHSKHYLLTSRLDPLVRKENLGSIADLVAEIRRSPRGRLESAVVEAMTTNETSFFRDIHPFTALTETVVPEIIASRGAASGLTIWSAACSSGQEVYSLAVTVADRFPELFNSGRLRIVATDISPEMVERTKAGRFSQLEVNRGLPARLLVRFFKQDGPDWVANAQLRQVIDARTLNLIGPWTNLPSCDIVFCRNVLIYFNTETKRRILERIRREVLRPNGYLFLGSSETTLNVDDAWNRRSIGRSIAYSPLASEAAGGVASPGRPQPMSSPALLGGPTPGMPAQATRPGMPAQATRPGMPVTAPAPAPAPSRPFVPISRGIPRPGATPAAAGTPSQTSPQTRPQGPYSPKPNFTRR